MSHKGAAVLVGVNGLLALEAIDKQMLQGLLEKAIRLEGSGVSRNDAAGSDPLVIENSTLRTQQQR